MSESSGETDWLEFVVDVPEDLSDPSSEYLVSLLERGVVIEDLEDLPGAGRRQRIRAYLSRGDLQKGRLVRIGEYLAALQKRSSVRPEISWSTRNVPEEDWGETWKRWFRPFRVGCRFVVKPSWEPHVHSAGDVVIEIDPGSAFGTGTHASTALVLEAMEALWERRGWAATKALDPDPLPHRAHGLPRVLDVGTGTGILGIAAARLGASRVLCLDTDPSAVEAARSNIFMNHVHALVTVTISPLGQIEGDYDVILANLDRDTLVRLAGDLCGRLEKGGILIASGLLLEQQGSVEMVFSRHGLETVERKFDARDREWACLYLSRA